MTISATVRQSRKDLGLSLRRLRTERQLTLSELACRAGMSISKVSKIEHGNVAVTSSTILQFSHALELDSDDEQRLLRYVKSVRNMMSDDVGTSIESLIGLLLESSHYWFQNVDVLPAPLQTAEYASRCFDRFAQFGSFGTVTKDEFRYLRMRQKARLYDPLASFRFTISERVLWEVEDGRRIVSGEQIDHLLELAELPSVDIRIAPSELWAFPVSAFILLDDKAVYVDCLPADLVYVTTAAVDAYRAHLMQTWQYAVKGATALALIEAARPAGTVDRQPAFVSQ
jgi:transcriptional regulator with XRE-family HTH domain